MEIALRQHSEKLSFVLSRQLTHRLLHYFSAF